MNKSENILSATLGNLDDWRFTGRVIYHPAESLDDWFCTCGARILYAHEIENVAGDSAFSIGSECITKFKRKFGAARARDARAGAQYDYVIEHGICVKCSGSGKWQNPYRPDDVRMCFGCGGTGKAEAIKRCGAEPPGAPGIAQRAK